MSEIASAVRRLRRHLGLTQANFAKKLGVDQTAVSQYERGRIQPSTHVLLNLYFLAESPDAASNECRECFLKDLRRHVDRGQLGSSVKISVEELVQIFRVMGRMRLGDALLGLVPEEKVADFGLQQFVPAVADVLEDCDTVDLAVSNILRLWAAYWRNPAAIQCFQDALGFLRGNLWKTAGSGEEPLERAKRGKPSAE